MHRAAFSGHHELLQKIDVVIHQSLWVLVLGLVFGCTAVGTGDRTVIRATADETLANEFPFLLTESPSASDRALIVDQSGPAIFPATSINAREARFKSFQNYMGVKYGTDDYKAALLAVTFRDSGRLPAFAPDVNTVLRQEILKVLNDNKLKKEERDARVQELRAIVLNAPEAAYSTTFNRSTGQGEEIFHYFPRLQIDLAADLLSNSMLDRFSQIVMYIRLPDNAVEQGVRFLNFSPKASDIAEYSRGQFKQSAALEAKAAAGRTGTSGSKVVSGDTTKEEGRGFSLGADISFTASEEYTRQLKDALEKRTAGIVEDGRSLIVQMRSIRQLRIGGTYQFDVMLEIPSKVSPLPHTKGTYYALEPKIKIIKPEIALIGVVRHVYDRGTTGVFNIVPEIENDDVFEQVVLNEPVKELWSYNRHPWIRPYEFEPPSMYTVHVVSNHELARFVVTDVADGSVLARGKGEEHKAKIKTSDMTQPATAMIEFQPIIITPQNGGAVILNPTPTSARFTIGMGDSGKKSFTVNYQ